ncbi:hypothetical protein GQ457_05G011530 [Hibiscus cannabinus]
MDLTFSFPKRSSLISHLFPSQFSNSDSFLLEYGIGVVDSPSRGIPSVSINIFGLDLDERWQRFGWGRVFTTLCLAFGGFSMGGANRLLGPFIGIISFIADSEDKVLKIDLESVRKWTWDSDLLWCKFIDVMVLLSPSLRMTYRRVKSMMMDLFLSSPLGIALQIIDDLRSIRLFAGDHCCFKRTNVAKRLKSFAKNLAKPCPC